MSGHATGVESAGPLHAVFFGAGALAIAAQVLLLRELMVSLAGDESALGVGLAAWLGGIAVGAWLARKLARDRGTAAAAGIAGLAIMASVGILAGRVLRAALTPPPGELPGFGLAVTLALAMLTPAGALVGWTFTALAALASRVWVPAEGITRLYISESLGSLAGGVLVSFLIVPRMTPLRGALLVGALALALALPAALAGRLRGGPGLIATLAALLATFAFSPRLDLWSERARFAGVAPQIPLRGWTDTPYQHLALGGADVRHLYLSGQYAGSFPDPYVSETLAHTVACLAPRPGRVLALGGLERGPLRFLLAHPVRDLTLVEPDAGALAFLRPRLPAEDQRALVDPRLRLVHDDPRRFLARSGDPFQLMLLLEPDPVTLLRARLTTVEFYRLCARRLAPDGVVVVSVKTAPNVLTGETAALAGSLFRALGVAFPVVKATPGPDTLMIAGWSPDVVTLDPAVLAARWHARGVASSVFAAELIPLLVPPERVRAQEAVLREAARDAMPSCDDRPVSFLNALARRQRETGSRLGRAFAALGRLPPALLALLAFAPSVLALARLCLRRRRTALAAQHAVAVTGAAAMAWSLLLLFSFQTRAGALYGQLGLLTALFMLGLAAGAAAMRAAVHFASRALPIAAASAFGYAVLLALVLPLLGSLAESGTLLTLAAHGGLLLLAGLVTGALFPAAAATLVGEGQSAGEAAGRLETADHLGAGLAALFGAVVFIPALGLTRSAWLLVALQGLTVVMVSLARSDRVAARRSGSTDSTVSP